jgi:hypothetical protein
MIPHQDKGGNSHPEAPAQVGQQLQKLKTVRVVAENGLALISPRRDVVASAGPLDAQGGNVLIKPKPVRIAKPIISIVEM